MARLDRAFHRSGTRSNAKARESLQCSFDFSWSQAADHEPDFGVRFNCRETEEKLSVSFTRKEVEYLVNELTELLERHKP